VTAKSTAEEALRFQSNSRLQWTVTGQHPQDRRQRLQTVPQFITFLLIVTACTLPESATHAAMLHNNNNPRKGIKNLHQLRLGLHQSRHLAKPLQQKAMQEHEPSAAAAPVSLEKLTKPAPMMTTRPTTAVTVSKWIQMELISTAKQYQACATPTTPAINCAQRQPTAACVQNLQRSCSTFCDARSHNSECQSDIDNVFHSDDADATVNE
jgi:hypothetical protein